MGPRTAGGGDGRKHIPSCTTSYGQVPESPASLIRGRRVGFPCSVPMLHAQGVLVHFCWPKYGNPCCAAPCQRVTSCNILLARVHTSRRVPSLFALALGVRHCFARSIGHHFVQRLRLRRRVSGHAAAGTSIWLAGRRDGQRATSGARLPGRRTEPIRTSLPASRQAGREFAAGSFANSGLDLPAALASWAWRLCQMGLNTNSLGRACTPETLRPSHSESLALSRSAPAKPSYVL